MVKQSITDKVLHAGLNVEECKEILRDFRSISGEESEISKYLKRERENVGNQIDSILNKRIKDINFE